MCVADIELCRAHDQQQREAEQEEQSRCSVHRWRICNGFVGWIFHLFTRAEISQTMYIWRFDCTDNDVDYFWFSITRYKTLPDIKLGRFKLLLRIHQCFSAVFIMLSLRFNGHFSRWTWVSRYQNVSILDFIGDRDDWGGGDNWRYKRCKAAVKLSPPTYQHPIFLQAGCLSCCLTKSVRALKEKITFHGLDHPNVKWVSSDFVFATEGSWLLWWRVAKPIVSPLMPVPQQCL